MLYLQDFHPILSRNVPGFWGDFQVSRTFFHKFPKVFCGNCEDFLRVDHILAFKLASFLRELQRVLRDISILSLKCAGIFHIWESSCATPLVFHSNAQRNYAFGRNCEFMPPFSQLNVTPNDTFNFFYHPNSQILWDFEQIGRRSHSFTRKSRRIGHSSKSCRLVQTFLQKCRKKSFLLSKKICSVATFFQPNI